jgi:hypothetical protein
MILNPKPTESVKAGLARQPELQAQRPAVQTACSCRESHAPIVIAGVRVPVYVINPSCIEHGLRSRYVARPLTQDLHLNTDEPARHGQRRTALNE